MSAVLQRMCPYDADFIVQLWANQDVIIKLLVEMLHNDELTLFDCSINNSYSFTSLTKEWVCV